MTDHEKTMRRVAWDTYFASLASMNRHPGTTRDQAERRPLAEIAAEADEMLRLRDERAKRGEL